MSERDSTQDSADEMPKAYDSRDVEPRWYAFWEEAGLFRASDAEGDDRETYTIAIPPPNVTGSLHMGHACRTTFEDVLIRHKRMQGKNTLWLPGTDHAGIATQVMVEREIAKEGLTRQELGREAFLDRVWQWKEAKGGRIMQQLRIMGASCDWSRERFTMDEGLSVAVREAFVQLYEEGLIYRGTRLVNWDVGSQTVLSDLEVDQQENVEGELFDFAYPVSEEDGGGEIVVSTTRPETMLGDTAIAVHPDDERYKHLHGKKVKHPFVDRMIPIISDAELVDMEFGTGCVKVTPAHDPNDFATGKRHGLEEINILNLDGTLNEEGGPFQGMDRFVARKAVKAKLEEAGLARGSKKHMMTLPKSQRSHTVVEPMISTQWFVKMEPLAKPAIEVVEDGRVEIVPEEWKKTYFHWMRNIQDWCISRQLWWGHPIPAWYCPEGHVTVAKATPSACGDCGATELTQDEDVLDTWFSSALWPFSTLGWPAKTVDLERFYPTSDMETGYDILFFWVARMIVMGLHFMDEVPFRRVLLSGMVTDEHGDKMSKTRGNVIDPLDVIHGATLDELVAKAEAAGAKPRGIKHLTKNYPDGYAAYGADALRMTLLSYSPQQKRIALSMKRIEGYRNFANKLWNASRFILMNLSGTDAVASRKRPEAKALANRWVLSRLHHAVVAADRGLEDYRVDDASSALYHFVWDELCDWYLELTKPLLAEGADPEVAAETRATLVHTLDATLRALHPMMPFITEEIWQRVPKSDDAGQSIMVAPFPTAESDALLDEDAEREVALLQTAIVGVRTIRAEHHVAWATKVAAHCFVEDATDRKTLERERHLFSRMTNAEVTIVDTTDAIEAATGPRTAVFFDKGVKLVVPEVIDVAKEQERLGRELKKVDKDLAQTTKKLGNEKFIAKAPPEVVETEKARLTELTNKKTQLETALTRLA
ncbi:MAG: valine--tRNA ligase [Deltaproteobacteria bacterium]|nr:MAG: valine--tRNA ligase [Deltaproteobacteria bacterium]